MLRTPVFYSIIKALIYLKGFDVFSEFRRKNRGEYVFFSEWMDFRFELLIIFLNATFLAFKAQSISLIGTKIRQNLSILHWHAVTKGNHKQQVDKVVVSSNC